MTTNTEIRPRPLNIIAHDITRNWPKPYFGAVPYLKAMYSLNGIGDSYGYDNAKSIVLYFLSNAATWRGPEAKRLKAELKAMLKARPDAYGKYEQTQDERLRAVM